MVDFDKFEKNVKDKYGNQDFPFDEQNWEKAAKLIDASRKGKNRGGIFLLSAVALLCTSGLVYYFGFSDSTKALQKDNLASNQVVITDNSVGKNDSQTKEESVSTTPSTEETNNSSENTSSSHEIVSSNNTSKNNSSNLNSVPKTNSKVSSTKTQENSLINTTEENSNNTSTTETKTEEKTNPSNNTSIENNNKPTETRNSKPSKKPVQANEGKKITPAVLGNNNNTAQNNTKPSTALPNTNETGNTNKMGAANNVADNNPTKTTSVTDSTIKVVAAIVKPTESVLIDSVPPMRKSKADSLAAMMPKGDGVSYATNVKEKHNAKNILFAEVGTTYLLGWSGSGKTEAGGFNPLVGINFQHYFSNAISIQVGVQYSTIGNLSNTSHTISTVKYDLGVEQDVTSIKYQKLHYVVAPIKLVFNAGDKNYIGIGCNVGYLLNSESKKEKYKTFSSDPNAVKNNLTSTKETGYVEGFNPIDIQLAVSYRRRIYKGLSANAEFIYGLTDTKNNTFFKSNSFDRSVGFKVSLCYDLFKK